MADSIIRVPAGAPPAVVDACEAAVLAMARRLESDNSRAGYLAVWRRWQRFVGDDPAGATATDVDRWLETMRTEGLAKSTRAWSLSILRTVYGELARQRIVAANPAEGVQRRKLSDGTPTAPRLSASEMGRLLEAYPADGAWIERRNRAMLWIYAGTALRRRDVPLIRVEDMVQGPQGMEVRVTVKGNKTRMLAIPPESGAALNGWLRFSGITAGYVFPSTELARGGHQVSRAAALGVRQINLIFNAAAKRAGLPVGRVTPHAVRRSWVTFARLAGVPLDQRQAALLHEHQSTTERYDVADRSADPGPGSAVMRYILSGGKDKP